MRSAPLRLGMLLAGAALATACNTDTTSPEAGAPLNGISARGGSRPGGDGDSVSGTVLTGIVDSSRIVSIGVYCPSYQDVRNSGSHAFRATAAIKIRSSSDVPLGAGACAEFTDSVSGGAEYTNDCRVLSADKCGV
jgi:hypothetical protein